MVLDELRSSKARIRESVPTTFTGWIESILWTHYFTLTFKYPPSPEQAMRLWGRYLSRGCTDPRASWFVATDRGQIGGRIHLHGLACYGSHVDAAFLNSWWRGNYGIANVRTFKSGGGAGRYVAKYIWKDGEGALWDIGGHLPVIGNLNPWGGFRNLLPLSSGYSTHYECGHTSADERSPSLSQRSEPLHVRGSYKDAGTLEIEEVSRSGLLTRRIVNTCQTKMVTCGPSTWEIHATGLRRPEPTSKVLRSGRSCPTSPGADPGS